MATFIDSSFWIALRARSEPHHSRAVDMAKRLAANRELLETTDFVFAEVHAYFSRMVRLQAQVIADFWQSRMIRMNDTTFSDKEAAIKILREHQDKTYSFCDALSFVVMQRLKLRRVVAFDEHFHQFGQFEVIS